MDNIIEIMEAVGVPYAYDHFAEGESPSPPFCVFRMPESNDFAADGINYYKKSRVNIELYTDKKDPALEAEVEAVLDGHSNFYIKSEVWISSERLYEVLYQFELEVKYAEE